MDSFFFPVSQTLSEYGGRYVGQFHRGLPHGQGVFELPSRSLRIEGVWSHGSFFEGERDSAGLPHGKGTSITLSKQVIGNYVHGEVHGVGRQFLFADGSTYEGNFDHGYRQGHGIERFADGSVYEGEWKRETTHGVRCGEGKWTEAKAGVCYEGQWKSY